MNNFGLTILLSTSILAAQTPVNPAPTKPKVVETPEQILAKAKQNISNETSLMEAYTNRINIAKNEEKMLSDRLAKLIVDKQKLISDTKTKLGLDTTWNWDDTTNSFIQTKK